MTNNDHPLIHLFTYQSNYFVYDTNANKLMNIPQEVYIELNELKKVGISRYLDSAKNNASIIVSKLINKGYFSQSNFQKIEFPNKEYVEDLLKGNINKIILQITRDCNFDCRYCSFAGNGVYDRTHEKKNMDFSVAKSSIDLLAKRSIYSDKVYITFYGGEPFLEFDLIKKCINYATSIIKTKDIVFNATINASILGNDIINYLKKNSFDLLISLDGPRDVHDNNRRFRKNGNGTHDAIMKNITNLIDNHKEYFENHVTFNAVVLSNNKLSEIKDFFENELCVPLHKIKIQYADLAGMDYIQDVQIDYTNNSELPMPIDDPFANKLYEYSDFQNKLFNKKSLSPIWQHNGPCIPGVQRLFINCNGEFFPCEKASEKSSCLKIGDLENGFDMNAIYSLLSIGELSSDECGNCWAKRFCDICAIKCVDFENDTLSRERKLDMCKKIKSQTINDIKNYIKREKVKL